MEALGTSKYCPAHWHHPRSTPTYLRMDARRRPGEVHQEGPRCRPHWSRKYPCRRVRSYANSCHQLCDVAEGLHFLHSRNVVHEDLKGVRNWH